MKAVIYANRERGYDFYESTPGFPDGYRSAVRAVCGALAEPDGLSSDTACLRWAPLDGSAGLLSVIFRFPHGNADQRRGHNAAVNFLLDQEEADRFFAAPLSLRQEAALRLAMALCSLRGQLPDDDELSSRLLVPFTGRRKPDPPERKAEMLMLSAAFRADGGQQFYLACDEEGESLLESVLWAIPPRLRRTVSFHTGILSAAESKGICLNLCTPETLSRLCAAGFSGGGLSDKYGLSLQDGNTFGRCEGDAPPPPRTPLGRKLREQITTWESYLHLLKCEDTGDSAGMLGCVPDVALCTMLDEGIFSQSEIKLLAKSGEGRAQKLALSLLPPPRRAQKKEADAPCPAPRQPNLLLRMAGALLPMLLLLFSVLIALGGFVPSFIEGDQILIIRIDPAAAQSGLRILAAAVCAFAAGLLTGKRR